MDGDEDGDGVDGGGWRWMEMVMVMVMSVKRMSVIGFLVWTSSSGQYGKRFKHRVL